MNIMKRVLCSFLFTVLSAFAADVTLKDGTLLKNVKVVSYAESAVVLKWEGGAGSVPYENWPEGKPAHAPKPRPIDHALIAKQRAKAEADREARRVSLDAASERLRIAYEKEKAERQRREEIEDAMRYKKIIIGMTEQEVKQSWGDPDKINVSGNAAGRTEQWVYYRGKWDREYVYLTNGVLTAYN